MSKALLKYRRPAAPQDILTEAVPARLYTEGGGLNMARAALFGVSLDKVADIVDLLRTYRGGKANSLVGGGPLGWSWYSTLAAMATDHHGNMGGFGGTHHAHTQLSGIGVNDHHAQDHTARHDPGGADALSTSYFRTDGSLGMTGNLKPNVDGVRDIGEVSLRWQDLRLSRDAYVRRVLVGEDQFLIRQTYFGVSGCSSYRVLQLGFSDTAERSLALNFDPSTIAGVNFSGRGQILIPKDRSILAPNAAGTDWRGVLRFTGDKLYLGGALSGGELSGNGLRVGTDGHAYAKTIALDGTFNVGKQSRYLLTNGYEHTLINRTSGSGTFLGASWKSDYYSTSLKIYINGSLVRNESAVLGENGEYYGDIVGFLPYTSSLKVTIENWGSSPHYISGMATYIAN